MIYKPVDAYPNNGVFIDADYYNDFTVKVQGASSQVKGYRLYIYNANDYSTIYEDKVTTDLSRPYVSGETINIPVIRNTLKNDLSYYWKVRLYQTQYDMFITKVKIIDKTVDESMRNIVYTNYTTNIKEEMSIEYNGNFYKIIGVVNSESENKTTLKLEKIGELSFGVNDYVNIYSNYVESIEFPFHTTSTIVATLSSDTPTIVTSRKQEFKIHVNDNAGIKWYRYVLKDDEGELIDDTGKIYNSLLTYTFDGFISDTNYTIKAYVCDTNNITVETNDYHFFVEYLSPDLNLPASVSVDYENDAIKVSWVDDAYSIGKVNGTYSFVDGYVEGKKSVKITSGVINYDEISGYSLNTSEEYTIFVDLEFDETKQGKILELQEKKGNYYIYVEENNIYLNQNDEISLLGKVLNTEKNTLQTSNTAEQKVAYIWNDDETWDDNKYWTESLPFKVRFKITVLANETIIKEVL